MTSGAKVLEQGDLPAGGAAGHGHHGGAQGLGPVVRAQSAGEQAVAVGVVDRVRGRRPGGHHAPGHEFAPVLDVALGVADHGGRAGGAGGGVDADDLVLGYGEHAEGILVAEILLDGEGQQGDVLQGLDVLGLDSLFVEFLFVERDVGVNPFTQRFEPAQLERFHFLPGQGLVLHVVDHPFILLGRPLIGHAVHIKKPRSDTARGPR